MVSRSVAIFVGLWVFLGLTVGIVAGLIFALKPDSRAKVYIVFDDVPGLHNGAPVRLAGVRIGTVESAVPQRGATCHREDDSNVHLLVTARIERDQLHRIRKDARFWVTTVSILGEHYVEIDIGTGDSTIQDGDRLCGQPGVSFQTVMDEGGRALKSGGEVVANIQRHGGHIQKNVGRIFTELDKSGLSRDSKDPVEWPKFKRVSAAYIALKSTIQKLHVPYIDISRILPRIEKIRNIVQRRLREAGVAAERINNEPVFELMEIVSEVGDRVRLMQDNLLVSAATIQTHLRFISGRFRDKRYTLGAFAADLEMQNDVKGLQRDLKRYLTRFLLAGGDESIPAR